MLSGNIPEDVMKEIIVRLPVKSLLRFKCVAKSWYALITDPSFITKQRRRLKLMFQSCPDTKWPASVISVAEEPYAVQHLELPFLEKDLQAISVYGQCNGIVCLFCFFKGDVHGEQSHLILWNPTTKEVKAIPAASQCLKGKFGFGFDPNTKDYKIVRFLTKKPFEEEQSLVQVYNLSTNSWREINVDVPTSKMYYQHWGSYLNGAYHWLTVHYEFDYSIVSFDFRNEVFGIIRLPCEVRYGHISEPAVVDESLAIITTYYSSKQYHVEIWVMNEYGVESSWTKKFHLQPFSNMGHVLGFWGDNEILIGKGFCELVLINLQNQEGRIREFRNIFGEMITLRMLDYVGSLVPLAGGEWKYKKK